MKRVIIDRQVGGVARNTTTDAVQSFLKHQVGIDPALH